MIKARVLGVILSLSSACATSSIAFDPQHPAEAWTAQCYPQSVEGLGTWVFLQCKFINRTAQSLLFPPTHLLASEQGMWRQPSPSEWERLKHDLQIRKKTAALPPFLGMNGSGSWESFLAQTLVLSGVWILKTNSGPDKLQKTDKNIRVEAGKDMEQVFVLYREQFSTPGFVVLGDESGLFKKTIRVAKDPGVLRQRPALEDANN